MIEEEGWRNVTQLYADKETKKNLIYPIFRLKYIPHCVLIDKVHILVAVLQLPTLIFGGLLFEI